MKNLDLMAQETCQAMVKSAGASSGKDLENLATKTLGVLQENGVYASILFLFTRPGSEKLVSNAIRCQLLELAGKVLDTKEKDKIQDTPNAALAHVSSNICSDLATLILVKQVWEQALVYARYSAKANKKEE